YLASSGGARTNKRLTLPVVGSILVIVRRAIDLPNHIAIAAIRAQTKIDAIYRAFLGCAADDLNNALRYSGEEFLVADRRLATSPISCGFAVPRVKEQQIDVRRVVQLAASELAQ